jgi:hypothetical protein
MCLFLPLAGTVANQQSILEVMEGEKLLHVIDLGGTARKKSHGGIRNRKDPTTLRISVGILFL